MGHRTHHLGAHRLEHFPLSDRWALVADSSDPIASQGCAGEVAEWAPLFDTPEQAAEFLADRGVMVAADGRLHRYRPHDQEPAPLAGAPSSFVERAELDEALRTTRLRQQRVDALEQRATEAETANHAVAQRLLTLARGDGRTPPPATRRASVADLLDMAYTLDDSLVS
jgi:hypothetical protein